MFEGGNLFQCEETGVRLSMPIRNRATSVRKRKRRLQPLPAMASHARAKAGAFAYIALEHPLVQGTDGITPEQPDDCTHGEVGAKRDF
jgi:hypothetical protein